MKEKIFAFDIDGTLINSYGKTQNYVDEIFRTIDKNFPNAKIVFASGGDTLKIEKSVKIIEDSAGVKIKNPYIISYTGAVIIGPDKQNVVEPTSIDELTAQDMEKIVYGIDEFTYITYSTDDGNFFIDYYDKDPEKWNSADKVVKVARELARYELAPATRDQISLLHQQKKVRAMCMIVMDMEKNKQMCDNLRNYAKNKPGLNVFGGFDLCVGFANKFDALKKVFKAELENIYYFGDGHNDLDSLNAGKLKQFAGSVGVGTEIEVLKTADLAVPQFNQFVIDYILGNLDKKECVAEFNLLGEKRVFISTPETKQQVIEQIRAYAIEVAPKLAKLKTTFF